MENTIAGEVKPVETPTEVKTEVVTPAASQEPSAADLLAAKDAEIAKLSEERDNYKRGMLKAKGKIEEETSYEEDEDLDAKVARKVQEVLYNEKIAQAQREKEVILQKTLRENEELRLALKNRAGGAPTSMGSNLDKTEVEIKYWTPEQEADLKSKGIDPKKAFENLPKGGLPGQTGIPVSITSR